MSNISFIQDIAPFAVQEMVRTSLIGKPILASYTIAQACLESGYGKSPINGNYFGVKGSGDSYETKEFVDGEWITITASFATYSSLEGSVIGHSQFLLENGRYTKYGVISAGLSRDWKLACTNLQKAGYATDPSYATLLVGIINSFKLYKYDEEADQVLDIITQLQSQYSEMKSQYNEMKSELDSIKLLVEPQPIPGWAKTAVDWCVSNKIIAEPDKLSQWKVESCQMRYNEATKK